MAEAKTGLHGFPKLVDFIKATTWLGGTLLVTLWAVLTWALDDRYAPADIMETVEETRVAVDGLQKDVRRIELWQLSEKLFDLKYRVCKEHGSTYFARELRDLKERYQKMNGGVAWIEPTCEDLR